ncbi:unnamed protein product [Schistocephalus solidus]|uniref:Uncharacterized protein n=1 Tax=Schistocephalus solidus TaxID=70667 RepID=A0A183TGH8_SCHSO|nr:unnamed protein product [Schistocephalus solidus]
MIALLSENQVTNPSPFTILFLRLAIFADVEHEGVTWGHATTNANLADPNYLQIIILLNLEIVSNAEQCNALAAPLTGPAAVSIEVT